MTQEEKLKKIIDKAIDNGWKNNIWGVAETGELLVDPNRCNDLIFSKPFLKAFFGEKPTISSEILGGDFADLIEITNWKHQAHKLVLADNKIDYLYKFI